MALIACGPDSAHDLPNRPTGSYGGPNRPGRGSPGVKHPTHHARVTPDKIAYRMAGSGAALTFAELDARSNQGAQALRSLGVGPGEHIAILMENCLAFLEVCWAAQRSGVVFTPITPAVRCGNNPPP